MSIAEVLIYALIAVVLLAGAVVALAESAYRLVLEVDDDPEHAVTRVLDRLLLVFILVELLSAVRVTVRERKLMAEPFLIVGMIAAIKEIVVEAVGARDLIGTEDDRFTDSMIAIGV